jgi:hypothetical protein
VLWQGGLITVKRLLLIYLVIISAFAYSGCVSNKPQEPPEIKITFDNQTINYVVGKNKWDGAVYDRENTFKTILKEDSKIVVPYIKLGKTLNIEFKQNPPEVIEIFDYLLNEKGENKYSDKTIIQIPAKLKGGKFSFEFNQHFATALSSNSDDYKDGRTLRGFKINCRWGNKESGNECEYGFIIRTDAD